MQVRNNSAEPQIDRQWPAIMTPVVAVLLTLSAVCLVLITVRAYRLEFVRYAFLLWNLFLAWLPLLASMSAVLYAKKVRGPLRLPGLTVIGIVWLLLFPNAPYLTTDFTHLILDRAYMDDNPRLLMWFDLIVFFLFAWVGLLLGYVSMRHFQALVERSAGSPAGWLFVTVSSLLAGFGVYLGRVVRLNSWDAVFSPFRLMGDVLEGLNFNAVVFTFMFGAFYFFIYLTLYALQRNGDAR